MHIVLRFDNGYFATEDTATYKIEEKGTLFTTVINNATNISDIIEHSKTTFVIDILTVLTKYWKQL